MNERSDQELVRECLRGNRSCFSLLLERYEKPVYNLALRIAGTRDDAEDITQTTFVKVFENLVRYDPRRKFFSWLYRIALNEALNFKRAMKDTADAADVLSSEENTAQDAIEQQEEQERIEQAIYTLHEDLRAVIVLHYFGECSYNDISYILSIPERTVKSRLYEARERLRRILTRPRTS